MANHTLFRFSGAKRKNFETQFILDKSEILVGRENSAMYRNSLFCLWSIYFSVRSGFRSLTNKTPKMMRDKVSRALRR